MLDSQHGISVANRAPCDLSTRRAGSLKRRLDSHARRAHSHLRRVHFHTQRVHFWVSRGDSRTRREHFSVRGVDSHARRVNVLVGRGNAHTRRMYSLVRHKRRVNVLPAEWILAPDERIFLFDEPTLTCDEGKSSRASQNHPTAALRFSSAASTVAAPCSPNR